MVMTATAACIALALLAIYSLVTIRKKKEEQQRTKANAERTAKDSFRVRRSHLMSISGRGKRKNNCRKYHNSNKRGQLHDVGEACTSSLLHKIASALKQLISSVLSWISFGYYRPRNNTTKQINNSTSSSIKPASKKINMENYYDETVVVGLDCEMVGGGRGGWKSLLARCSVVTLDCNPIHSKSNSCAEKEKENMTPNKSNTKKDGRADNKSQQKQTLKSLDQNLHVLYDKYVIPKGKITDYRTQWSGITKDTYKNSSSESSIPIVTFEKCQSEISQLFSSIDGKRVLVVGHALENDFEALEIEHPPSLTRDTAFYGPYMRRVRKKMYPRKLSTLSEELLGIEIQQQQSSSTQQSRQQSQSAPSPPEGQSDNSTNNSSLKNESAVGHSSVEDAAAALRLYWHNFCKWERSLDYPLDKTQQQCTRSSWPPLKMYLDGCNLPIGMRGIKLTELMANKEATTIPSKSFRLTSRKRESDHHHLSSNNISTIDWIPTFQSALSSQSIPKLQSISVMFDGAKFSNRNQNNGGSSRKKERGGESFDTRVFCIDSFNNEASKDDRGPIQIEITKDCDSADDVLFHRCCPSYGGPSYSASWRKVISLDKVIELLSSNDDADMDTLQNYIVVRRKAGGTKTHRRLFDKLHLRRPNEGALCLSAITPGLRKDALRTARELQRESRSIERVIECELGKRDDLRYVVVTDDVYLTERLVGSGIVLVLSFRQLQQMW